MSKISLIRATILLIEKIFHYLFFFTQNIKFEKVFTRYTSLYLAIYTIYMGLLTSKRVVGGWTLLDF